LQQIFTSKLVGQRRFTSQSIRPRREGSRIPTPFGCQVRLTRLMLASSQSLHAFPGGLGEPMSSSANYDHVRVLQKAFVDSNSYNHQPWPTESAEVSATEPLCRSKRPKDDNTAQSPLFSMLPPEIRLMIYELILCETAQVHIIVRNRKRGSETTELYGRNCAEPRRYCPPGSRCRMQSQPLLTCRMA
jgi:hypothetical protein